MILLPETTLTQALVVAERIRSSIAEMEFPPLVNNDEPGSSLHVTVSIGVAAIEPEKDTLLDLLTRADHSLYLAKKNGRNRVCVEG